MSKCEIKICGLTNEADARAALESGADYLGFVLYEKSSRAVAPAALELIQSRLPGGQRSIGVFVNTPRDTVVKVARDCGLYAVQLHGDEAADEFADMPLPVWRAVWLRSGVCEPDPGGWSAERWVVDAAPRGLYGGAGVTGDWAAAAALARERPIMLAGGLTPGNVADAVRQVRPAGVDTAGGVESSPGRKDHEKIRQFIRHAREGAAGEEDRQQ